MRYCIDPGHGDTFDHGASGRFAQESAITLAVSQRIRDKLVERGHQVVLTREAEDPSVSELWARVQIAEDFGADAFISIHCNSVDSPQAHGMEVFTSRGQDESDILANYVEQELASAFPGLTRRGLKEAGFGVLKGSMPSILIEWAFISNPEEEGLMADTTNQDMFADAVVAGIERFRG